MVGTLVIGENLRNTSVSFGNFNEDETSINLIEDGYDSQDVNFNG